MAEPMIDRTRLPMLAQMKDAAMGAHHKANATFNECHREAMKLRHEIDALKSMRPPSLEGGARKNAKLRELEVRLAEASAAMAEAKAVRDAASERLQSAAQLHHNCASHLGVRP